MVDNLVINFLNMIQKFLEVLIIILKNFIVKFINFKFEIKKSNYK